MRAEELPDFYGRLQVVPNADPRELEIAYHRLAKRFHPDAIATADPDQFQAIVEAYKFLRDPQRRAQYDAERGLSTRSPVNEEPSDFGQSYNDLWIEADAAIEDAKMIERILLSLYKQRRENPAEAGMVGWLLQEKLGCGQEHFDFHAWYLKEKGFVQIDQEGKLVISVAGVDHIIATSKHNQTQRRLTSMIDQGDIDPLQLD